MQQKGGTDMEKIRYALRKKTIILDLYFLVLDNFNFSKLFAKSFTCNSEIYDRPIYFEKNLNVITPMLILLHIWINNTEKKMSITSRNCRWATLNM